MSTVQLVLLGGSNQIETCKTMTLAWGGGDATLYETRFNLFIMRESDVGNDDAPVYPIGQTLLREGTFRWLRVVVGPGQYVVTAALASGSSDVAFTPTQPFSVFAGSDTSCVNHFAEGLSTSKTSSSTSLTRSTPAATDTDISRPTPLTSSNTAIIAGGTAAGVVGVLLLAAIVWYWLRRRRAPVAVRTQTASPSSRSHSKSMSFSRNAEPVPLVTMVPSSPSSHPSPYPSSYARPLPPPPPPLPSTLGSSNSDGQRSRVYAQSVAGQTEDSFADERDALREEFLLDAATSSGGGRRQDGRALSAIESSVASDIGVGPDRLGTTPALQERRSPRQMTFAVSNPDHTVWEDDDEGSWLGGRAR